MTQTRRAPTSARRSPRRRTLPAAGPGWLRISDLVRRPLAVAGEPLRLALTVSVAGIAVAGAAWRAGRRS